MENFKFLSAGKVNESHYDDLEGDFYETRQLEVIWETPFGKVGITTGGFIKGYHKIGKGVPAFSGSKYNEVNSYALYIIDQQNGGATWWKPNTKDDGYSNVTQEEYETIEALKTKMKEVVKSGFEIINGDYVWGHKIDKSKI